MSLLQSHSISNAKVLARSYLRRRRSQHFPTAETTQAFSQHLASLWRSYPAGSTIAAFLPMDTEPPIVSALTQAVAEGYKVLVPVVRPRRQLAWVSWQPQVEHVLNKLGIAEPVGERHGSEVFIQADVRLIPALAYDVWGRRLGQGGGYYDRLLEELGTLTQEPSTVGVVFEREILDGLPADSWDARLGFALTEEGLHRLDASAGLGRRG